MKVSFTYRSNAGLAVLIAAVLSWAAPQTLLADPTPAESIDPKGAVDMIVFYAQGFDFWNKVNQLTHGNQSPSDIATLLDSSFDNPQEGIASVQFRYHGPIDNGLRPYFNQVYFGGGGDALVGGDATNRILPDVEAYGIFTGHLDFGLGEAIAPKESGFEYRIGSTFGGGSESVISGSAVDLLGAFNPDRSSVFYTGLDLYAGFENNYNDALTSHYRITLSPTMFYSDHSDSATQFEIATTQFNLRWRDENEWRLNFISDYDPDFSFSLLTIAGQQPTPITILPRTWDAVHNIQAWPSIGQSVGLGTRVRVYGTDTPIGLTLDGGFYGGYFGASALLQIYRIQLATGTYGFEETSGYRSQESRIEFISLGGQFAI